MFNGERLRQLRLLYGMSRRELATKLDISEQAVWQFERNETIPKAVVKLKIANLFGARLDYFSQASSDTSFDMTAVAFRNESNLINKGYKTFF